MARAISLHRGRGPASAELIRAIFSRTGRAYFVGVTGPPGAGQEHPRRPLDRQIRPSGQAVGIIAVDPTSPFTGGAVLGDRVRMQAHAGDAGVFIRSMATRGHLGGLARATGDAALVLDAAGNEVMLIETVGVVRTKWNRADSRRHDGHAGAGRRRRRAGAEGRHHGDRGYLRREQGGPRRRRSARDGSRGEPRAARVRSRRSGARRSSKPSRRPARASPGSPPQSGRSASDPQAHARPGRLWRRGSAAASSTVCASWGEAIDGLSRARGACARRTAVGRRADRRTASSTPTPPRTSCWLDPWISSASSRTTQPPGNTSIAR